MPCVFKRAMKRATENEPWKTLRQMAADPIIQTVGYYFYIISICMIYIYIYIYIYISIYIRIYLHKHMPLYTVCFFIRFQSGWMIPVTSPPRRLPMESRSGLVPVSRLVHKRPGFLRQCPGRFWKDGWGDDDGQMIALIWWGGWQLLRLRQQKTNRLGTLKMQRNGHGGTCNCHLAVGVTCWFFLEKEKNRAEGLSQLKKAFMILRNDFFPKPLGWTLAKALGWLNFHKFP